MGIKKEETPLLILHPSFNAYLIWLRSVPPGLIPFALMVVGLEITSPGLIMSIARSRHILALLPLYILLMGALFLLPAFRVMTVKKTYRFYQALFYKDSLFLKGGPGQRGKEIPRKIIRRIALKRGPGQRLAGLCTLVLKGKVLEVRIPDLPYHAGLVHSLRSWIGEESTLP